MIASSPVLLGIVFVVLISAVALLQRRRDPFGTRRLLPSLPTVWINLRWLRRRDDDPYRAHVELVTNPLSLEERVDAWNERQRIGTVADERSTLAGEPSLRANPGRELSALAAFGLDD
jgi:hypothetical protein